MTLICRDEEIDILNQMLQSEQPEFLAIYGRRRVGKTYLIKQFFKDKKGLVFFNTTGSKKAPLKEQINHFTKQIEKVFYDNAKLMPGKNWDETFALLTQAMTRLPPDKKIVLFFDELPWMATPNSKLLQNLDYYWNQHWSDNSAVKLIICGSSASWIIHKIIKNKGGLYNRITRKIRLSPFKLGESNRFLTTMGFKLNHQQVLFLYMVTGGIPYYLMQMQKGLSAMQNIEKLAFSKNGFLLEEFDNLFSSLFDHDDIYVELIKIIAQHHYGIGLRELLELVGKNALGGTGLKKLKELEEAGFIMSFKPLYHKRQGIYYRVVDEYVLFYLKWIAPLRQTLQEQSLEEGNWQATAHNTPEWYAWVGYAFESVCYKHIAQIRKKLGLSPNAIASSWRYVPKKFATEKGAQIDLLFDRKDDAISLCEIKYTETPFALNKDYVDVLNRKMEVFKQQTRTKKQLFLALISANGIKNNYYTENIVDQVVTLDDLFNE